MNSFQVPGSLVVSGPLWTGPLHSKSYLEEMLNLAQEWGWIGNNIGVDLEKLLKYMIDESDPQLPFGYIKLDEVLFNTIFVIYLVLLLLSSLWGKK